MERGGCYVRVKALDVPAHLTFKAELEGKPYPTFEVPDAGREAGNRYVVGGPLELICAVLIAEEESEGEVENEGLEGPYLARSDI